MKRQVLAVMMLALLCGCAATPNTEVAEEDTAKRECIRQTGTHMKRSGRCVEAPGRVYTYEDLDRTGAQTLGDALQRISR